MKQKISWILRYKVLWGDDFALQIIATVGVILFPFEEVLNFIFVNFETVILFWYFFKGQTQHVSVWDSYFPKWHV